MKCTVAAASSEMIRVQVTWLTTNRHQGSSKMKNEMSRLKYGSVVPKAVRFSHAKNMSTLATELTPAKMPSTTEGTAMNRIVRPSMTWR